MAWKKMALVLSQRTGRITWSLKAQMIGSKFFFVCFVSWCLHRNKRFLCLLCVSVFRSQWFNVLNRVHRATEEELLGMREESANVKHAAVRKICGKVVWKIFLGTNVASWLSGVQFVGLSWGTKKKGRSVAWEGVRFSHQAPLSFLLHRFRLAPTNWNGCRECWEEGSANGTKLQFCFLLLIWYRDVATVNCFSLEWNLEACMHVFPVEEFTRSLIVRSLHSLLPALCRGWYQVSIGGLWVCKEMSDLVKGFVFLDIIECYLFAM